MTILNTVMITLSIDEFNSVMRRRGKDFSGGIMAAAGGGDNQQSWQALQATLSNLSTALSPVVTAAGMAADQTVPGATVDLSLALDEFNLVMQHRAQTIQQALDAAAASGATQASWQAVQQALGGLSAALGPMTTAVAATAAAAAPAS